MSKLLMNSNIRWSVTWLASSILGFALATATRDYIDPPFPSAESLEPTNPRKRAEELHLVKQWTDRRSNLSADRAAMMKAITSGNWDAATEESAVLNLLSDPSFINTIWQQSDPGARNLTIGKILKKISHDCPSGLWGVIDHADFTLTEVPKISEILNLSVSANPLDAFECIKRNELKIGPDQIKMPFFVCAGHPEGARALLADVVAEGKYSENTLKSALRILKYYDGALSPQILLLPAAQAFLKNEEEQKIIGAWLKKDAPIIEETLRAIPSESLKGALFDAVWSRSMPITGDCFEQLALAGRTDEQKFLLAKLVESGRTEDAVELLQTTKNLPATKENRDELVSVVASSIYQSGGDVGRAVTLLNEIGGEETYWHSVKSVLNDWASEDPDAARAFLPSIDDVETHAELQKIIEHSTLSQ